MEEIPQFENPKEEINYLSEKVNKRIEAGNEKEGETTSKDDAAKDVLREHIKNVSSGASAVVCDDNLLGMDSHKEQIKELINIAFSRGITESVKVARALGSPHLLDEFHDALIDRFYDKLIASHGVKKEITH